MTTAIKYIDDISFEALKLPDKVEILVDAVYASLFLRTNLYVSNVEIMKSNKINFNLASDKRGIELFVNKLTETELIDGTRYNATMNADLSINISIPEKYIHEFTSDLNYAFSKLFKYIEYQNLISKFTPGANMFPGYSFDDFQSEYNK